jgi:hypothetical protein
LPWEKEYSNNAVLVDALSHESNAAIFQEICYKQKAPENFRKILRACCTWSKYNRPNFTKIIQDFHDTSNTDHELRNERNITSYKTGRSHFEQQSSAQSRPQTPPRKNNRQLQVQHMNGALYDSEDDGNDIQYSTAS